MVRTKANDQLFSNPLEEAFEVEIDDNSNDHIIKLTNKSDGVNATTELILHNDSGQVVAWFCTSSNYNDLAAIPNSMGFVNVSTGDIIIGALGGGAFKIWGVGLAEFYEIDSSGNHDFKAKKVSNIENLVIPVAVPSAPVAGSIYFNTATNKLLCYNGTAWKEIQLI